ncbi:MAG: Coenzyme F420 hydrogenase/dehydrogenase, beta subunit C-terminal domain [Bacteroidetes bacterium]|nr:Coenzyme F420 hydrogenase/dehydrogenase, beta subunit C-terminal domain [Bacteroidota bacterium]
MITIKEKSDCCGCNACTQVCPKQCINMIEDKEGFLYPHVDLTECIDCGLCEKVCPVINQNHPRKPLGVYAAKNTNEQIRLDSSSGGLFTIIAQSIINQGGVVFGAKFNDSWAVVHDYSETIEGLVAFRKSKYVQSIIGNSFNKVLAFLKEGRKVLFTGTPCQIAGLKLFLRKEYENLLTIDIVCHGVPSPLVWRKYLAESLLSLDQGKKTSCANINDINFRNKDKGWKSFRFVLNGLSGNKKIGINQPFSQNVFTKGFLQNLYLRPSCHKCPAKKFKSGSDITLGDFWGIENTLPKMNDDRGTSLVAVNTIKGEVLYSNLALTSVKTSYKVALSGNPPMEVSVNVSKNRDRFYDDNLDYVIPKIKKYTKEIWQSRIKRYLFKIAYPIYRIIKNIAIKLLKR